MGAGLAGPGAHRPLVLHGSKVVIAARDLTSPDVVLGSSDGDAKWSVLSALPGEVLYVDFPSPANGFAAVCNDTTGSVILDSPGQGPYVVHCGTASLRRARQPERSVVQRNRAGPPPS